MVYDLLYYNCSKGENKDKKQTKKSLKKVKKSLDNPLSI